MATALLAVSVVGSLVILVVASRGVVRVALIVMILLGLATLPVLYFQAANFPQLAFVTQKVERLAEGFSTYGLAEGDETGRGWMFVDEMKAISREPFLGYIPHVTGQGGHGHSSLANSLSLFGLFGASFWFLALVSIMMNCLRNAHKATDKYVMVLTWFVLFLAGILNPTWHSPVALGAIFVFTLPTRTIPLHGTGRRSSFTDVSQFFGSFRFFKRKRHHRHHSSHRNHNERYLDV
jgi:hypothetical protein